MNYGLNRAYSKLLFKDKALSLDVKFLLIPVLLLRLGYISGSKITPNKSISFEITLYKKNPLLYPVLMVSYLSFLAVAFTVYFAKDILIYCFEVFSHSVTIINSILDVENGKIRLGKTFNNDKDKL